MQMQRTCLVFAQRLEGLLPPGIVPQLVSSKGACYIPLRDIFGASVGKCYNIRQPFKPERTHIVKLASSKHVCKEVHHNPAVSVGACYKVGRPSQSTETQLRLHVHEQYETDHMCTYLAGSPQLDALNDDDKCKVGGHRGEGQGL